MTHQLLPPWASTSGPRKAKIVILGEAWGETESQLRKPFVGESGKELWRMLGEAWPLVEPELWSKAEKSFRYGPEHSSHWSRAREEWLEATGILMTNVLALRPHANKMETLCASKKEVGGDGYNHPHLSQGKYLRPEYLPELDRLSQEIQEAQPNLVLALGNTACWAMLRVTNIGSIRGAVALGCAPGKDKQTVKVLPTYHPAGVMRQWSWRTIVVADLIKAWNESQFPEIRRPARKILVNPSIEEVEDWTAETLSGPYFRLSPDIETASGQISCIGFARSRTEALVIPFHDKARPGWNYWPTRDLEYRAWYCVKMLLECPIPKVGQNFIYDLQYLTPMGFRPRALDDDTMLLHHSMFPELQKGLGFLGSVYTNEASWKLMRRTKADTEKKDE